MRIRCQENPAAKPDGVIHYQTIPDKQPQANTMYLRRALRLGAPNNIMKQKEEAKEASR